MAQSSLSQEQFANVAPGSPGCTTDTTGTTCTITFGSEPGDINFVLRAYDGPNGVGSVLGYASADMAVVANQDNKFNVTLDGVAVLLQLSPGQTSIPAGVPADIPLAISAYDADNNLIVNSPDGYALPGGVSNSGTFTGIDYPEFSLRQNGQPVWADSSNPKQFTVSMPYTGLVLHYNGGVKENLNLSFTSGLMTATAPLKVSTPTANASLIYGPYYTRGLGGVATSGVTGVPGGANGSGAVGVDSLMYETPNDGAACGSDQSAEYAGVSTDANQRIAFIAQPPCFLTYNTASIVAFDPGTKTPAWSIGNITFDARALGFDASNAPYIYVDLGHQGDVNDVGQIDVLRPGSTGAYSTSMVTRSIDYVNFPEAMLVAADGTIYAAHVGDVGGHTALEAIDVFGPTANGQAGTSAVPIRYIGGDATGLNHITEMALDSQGNLYVGNQGSGTGTDSSITVFAPGANGNVAPIRTIAGSNTTIGQLWGIAVDSFDNLYAAWGGGSYSVFAPGANGNVAPARSFTADGGFVSGPITLLK